VWRSESDLIAGSDLVIVGAVLHEDRLHRLEILERELLEVVLQQVLGSHTRTDYEWRFPETPISQPFPSVDPIGRPRSFIVHHREHVLGDRLTVLTHKLAHTTAETPGTSAGIPADAGGEAFTRHSSAQRCLRSALNDAHDTSLPIVAGDRFWLMRLLERAERRLLI
jgi:hypothetical protein